MNKIAHILDKMLQNVAMMEIIVLIKIINAIKYNYMITKHALAKECVKQLILKFFMEEKKIQNNV